MGLLNSAFLKHRLNLAGFGLVPQLIAMSLAVVVAVTAGVLGWTLWTVREAELLSVQRSLSINLAILHNVLEPLGDDWKLVDGHLTLGGRAMEGRNDIADKVRDLAGGSATIFADDTRVLTNITGADGKRAIGTKLAAGPARDTVVGRSETYRGEAAILGVPHLTVYEPIRDHGGRRVGILFVGVPLTGVAATMSTILTGSLGGSVILLVCATGLLVVAVRRLLVPLDHLASAVHNIAAGALEQPVPCTGRRDQLGGIGRAIELLRATSINAVMLEQQIKADRMSRDAQHAEMDRLAREFGLAVSSALFRLAESANAMQANADSMVLSSEHTRSDMTATLGEAQASSQSLSTVAAAAEELAASVGDISSQAMEVGQSAEGALACARATDVRMQELSSAASQIGQVASLISEIANRTNLLALNATIEAARAGEAGKGFAVVASEVKALAGQTAGATRQIGAHVTAIQEATKHSGTSVREVLAAINNVSGMADTIGTAVGHQGSATQEIAAKVQGVLQSTVSATAAMAGAQSTASISEPTSRKVLEAAVGVASISNKLRVEVERFLTAIQADAVAGERRMYDRVPGNGAGAVMVGDGLVPVDCVINQLSLGGAAFDVDHAFAVGDVIHIDMPQKLGRLEAYVVGTRPRHTAVVFKQDAISQVTLVKTIAYLGTRSVLEPLAQAA